MRMVPRVRPEVRQVAAAGNAAALVLLVCLLADATTLLGGPESGPRRDGPAVAHSPSSSPGEAGGVVLVVLDGLRADTAADGGLMPRLAGLRRAGASGVAWVECLVPTTVAAVLTLATGRVPPPVGFFDDFGAAAEPDGGVFRAVARAGGRSFVAGPALWTDLFGRWVDESEVDGGFTADDDRVLAAGLGALRRGGFRLVVVHLQGLDEAGHLYGTADPRYGAEVRRLDRAVGLIWEALPAGFGLLVTSDHGCTAGGNHAGPEPAVLATPVVALGPAVETGALPALRQCDLPALLLGMAGLGRPGLVPASADGARAGVGAGVPADRPVAWSAVALAAGCAAWVWAGLGVPGSGAGPNSSAAFGLNLAVWCTLGVAAVGPRAGLAVALTGLAASAARSGGRSVAGPAAALAVGGAVGLMRVGSGLGEWPGLGPWAGLAAALAAYAAARGCPGWVGPAALGTGVGAAPAVWSQVLGRTLSLSTVDVRAAYGSENHTLGVALAAAQYVATDLLPVLGLLYGLRGRIDGLGPAGLGRFAGSMAAVLAGQGVALAVLLAPGATSDLATAALALAGLLRVGCETLYLFPVLAALVLIGPARTRPRSRFLS